MNTESTSINHLQEEQDHIIQELVKQEGGRLRNFIRKSIPDELEAEDLLQDVYYQLVEAYRLMKPIEQATAWLFTVARNKIRDRFRKKKTIPISHLEGKQDEEDGAGISLLDQLVAVEPGPDSAMMWDLLDDALYDALEDLPENQREVFIWHELEGKSFEEIARMTGEKKNTLISRKRYAVLYLREVLQDLYDELLTD